MQPFLLLHLETVSYKPTAMFSFSSIQNRIEAEIAAIEFNESPQSLFDPIRYILSSGGKRIRPALALMACNLYSESVEKAIKPALGMEVFHNFTLLHDDLMDEADMRRGRPTAHKLWNNNTAILSGDAMLIAAYRLIGETDPAYLKEILDIFTKTALEICEGQQYDMEFESRTDVTEDEYMEMIRLKTAVLLAACLKTGAIAGGAPEKDAGHLYAFGINIGLAFQLQDDLLDVYGNPETFGKNIGGDILCNKKTFLLINALKKSSGNQHENLIKWINKKEYDPAEKITAVTHIYNELNLKNRTEARIRDLYGTAISHLDKLSIGAAKTEILRSCCNQLTGRRS